MRQVVLLASDFLSLLVNPSYDILTLDLVVINVDFINCVNHTVFINDVKKYTFIMNHNFEWAGMVGAVGKISVFRPQNPQFDPLLM